MLKNLHEILRGDATYAMVYLLSDALSEAEAAAINNRVLRDPEYRDDLDGLLADFDAMGGLDDDAAVEAIARDYRQLLRDRRTKRRLALGMAAGILVALGAVLTVYAPWTNDRHVETYFTRIGEQQTIALADGSVVTLNTGGQLVVDYGGRPRRILLGRGEAYFEVAADPERPFMVDLGTHTVTALGTTFNVRKDPERYQVAVLEGAVAIHEATAEVSRSPPSVSADGQPVILARSGPRRVEAGWVAEVEVSRDELTAFQPESLDRYHDWRSGLLIFYDESLRKVVQELNRYSRRTILIEDTAILEWPVYTAIRVAEIDGALRALERALPIAITWHYDRIVITASRETEQHNP